MIRGGRSRLRGDTRRTVPRVEWLVTLCLAGALVVQCGGAKKTAATPSNASASRALPPGVPGSGDVGWCDPMPELGKDCTEDLKECTIVCDYASDTCAVLVCLNELWEYVERGEGAEKEEL